MAEETPFRLRLVLTQTGFAPPFVPLSFAASLPPSPLSLSPFLLFFSAFTCFLLFRSCKRSLSHSFQIAGRRNVTFAHTPAAAIARAAAAAGLPHPAVDRLHAGPARPFPPPADPDADPRLAWAEPAAAPPPPPAAAGPPPATYGGCGLGLWRVSARGSLRRGVRLGPLGPGLVPGVAPRVRLVWLPPAPRRAARAGGGEEEEGGGGEEGGVEGWYAEVEGGGEGEAGARRRVGRGRGVSLAALLGAGLAGAGKARLFAAYLEGLRPGTSSLSLSLSPSPSLPPSLSLSLSLSFSFPTYLRS
jgi:hypothetical protein